MSVRTYKRLAALVFVLSLCLTSVPAYADRYNESRWLAPGFGNTRDGLLATGDPDRPVGCAPPQVSRTGREAAVGVVGGSSERETETLWSALSHWFAGLLQRNGYRY